jgi:tetratricopeptide (TPR) repeat protein
MEDLKMGIMEFIIAISWPVVVLAGLIVLLLYKKPLGALISNLRSGSLSYKPKEGVTGSLEVNQPTSETTFPELLRQKSNEYIETKQNLLEDKSIESVLPITQEIVEVTEVDVREDWFSLFSKGRYKESHELLLALLKEQELKVQPASAYTWWLRGQSARALYKYDFQKGKDEFDSLLSADSEAVTVYFVYFSVLEEAGDYSKIYSLIDNYPGNKENKYKLLLRKAEYLFKNKDIDEAQKVLEFLISQNDSAETKAKAYLEKGKVLKEGNAEEAKNCFIRAYKILPTDLALLKETANLFRDAGEFTLELFLRKRLLELEPTPDNWAYLGNVYLVLGLNNHSMTAYETANNISENGQQWIISNLGNLYSNLNLYDKAVEFLRIAHAMNTANEYSTNRLALALAGQEKEDKKAVGILDEARILISKIEI